ncbi:hypothetical protein ACWCQL_11325 [Streptomyces sp. NPDC002073]
MVQRNGLRGLDLVELGAAEEQGGAAHFCGCNARGVRARWQARVFTAA